MPIAITTRYIGPTNTKGSRIKAMSRRGNGVVEYDSALDSIGNHEKAATTLAQQYFPALTGFISAESPSTDGYTFIFFQE
jgi:hypothetical protein